MVRGLSGNQRAAVVTVAADLRFQAHLTDNPRVLLDVIDRLSPSTLPLNSRALSGLERSRGEGEDDRVVLITDGIALDRDLPSTWDVVRVEKARENVGIVAADMQVLSDRENRLGLYFQLASSFERPRTFDVIVRRASDGVIGKLIEVTVVPGLNASEVYTLEDAEAGRWELELDLTDALRADNRAWLVADPKAAVRVRIDAEDGYFFEKAVRAFEAQGRLEMVDDAPDIVLAVGAPSDTRASLVFQPGGKSRWWQTLGEDLEGVVPKVLMRDHPVLRYVDASTWSFVGARDIRAPDGALVLVESDLGVPLVYTVGEEGNVAVVVNMDPVASEFYFSASFPVLIQSVAMALSGREMPLISSYAAGDVVKFPSGGVVEQSGGPFGPLTEFGFHRLTVPNQEREIGVSMFQVDETLLGFEKEVSSRENGGLAFGSPLAWWLTVFTMLVLVVESVLYHRRKVG